MKVTATELRSLLEPAPALVMVTFKLGDEIVTLKTSANALKESLKGKKKFGATVVFGGEYVGVIAD